MQSRWFLAFHFVPQQHGVFFVFSLSDFQKHTPTFTSAKITREVTLIAVTSTGTPLGFFSVESRKNSAWRKMPSDVPIAVTHLPKVFISDYQACQFVGNIGIEISFWSTVQAQNKHFSLRQPTFPAIPVCVIRSILK